MLPWSASSARYLRAPPEAALLLAVDVGNTNVTLGLFEREQRKALDGCAADWRLETRAGAPPTSTSRCWRSSTGARASISAPSPRSPSRRWSPRRSRRSSSSAAAPEDRAADRRPRHQDRRADPLREPARGGRRPDRQRGGRLRALAAGARSSSTSAPPPPSTWSRARGEYAGGVIAPGLTVSADALYQATAKLPRVEIVRPATVIGRNTVASMQSGLVFGYAGLVDAIVERMRAEVDFAPRVVGTGGPGAPRSRARRAPSTSATTC